MEKKDKERLLSAAYAHSWNADRSKLAVSANDHEVHIYKTPGDDPTKWEKEHTLQEHTGFVSGIDWCGATNEIVTCGHDRNAYVWKFDAGKWNPTLVILRINRAATKVRWSPCGRKFAVASGAKCVPICHYEEENNWYIAKTIKKHKSTVLDVAWSPNSKFVITGSTDGRSRIFSAFIKGLDSKEDDGFGAVFPEQHTFGECLGEFSHAASWVQAVSWAPSGQRLAFAGHGSSVHFVQLVADGEPVVESISTKCLPFMTIEFVNDDALVCAGFDCNLHVFSASGGKWAYVDVADKGNNEKKEAAPKKTGAFAAARDIFKASDNRGIGVGQKLESTRLPTRHQNAITTLSLVPKADGIVSSCGVDGKVLFWDLKKLKLI